MDLSLIQKAFEEDLAQAGDITSQAIFPPTHQTNAKIISREAGILSGIEMGIESFFYMDSDLKVSTSFKDGDAIKKGDCILEVSGATLSILKAERTALNILSHASGIASLTARYIKVMGETKTKLTCTRKTLPGLRELQKKAVKDGGGVNHRFGLYDAVMIKDNHIAACDGDILKTLTRVKENIGHMVKIEVEVDTLEQLQLLLDNQAQTDAVLLDNMSPDQIAKAIELTQGQYILEASGGITLETIADFAATNVDYISVGALTHSAKTFDFGLDYA